MAHVTDSQFRKWAFIEDDDTSVTDNIQMAIDDAEAEVENDLDYASFSDYEDEDGNLPAPLVKAILIKALQSYQHPDGERSSSVGEDGQYQRAIKPYVKLTKSEE